MDFLGLIGYQSTKPLMYNSVAFFLFFTVFLGIYIFASKNVKVRNIALLLFSLFIYYKISGYAVFVLLTIGVLDFWVGQAIFEEESEARKSKLALFSIVFDLGLLAYFKYTEFVTSNIDSIFHSGNGYTPIFSAIGISFFVFKSLGYVLALKNEELEEPETNIVNYLLFVSYFPSLLAGPISSAGNLLPQFKKETSVTDKMLGKGIFLIMLGAFKKIFIADFIAVNMVDRVFENPVIFSGFEALAATFGALIQLFCDFSGYTDMVMGLSLILGFQIEQNFNRPFMARNITEFWRRWHITLSNWLNANVFAPVSYKFRTMGKTGVIIAVAVTFTVSGVWHGANWTFIIWGILHGLFITIDILIAPFTQRLEKSSGAKLFNFVRIILTINVLAFTMIFFKATSIGNAMGVIDKILYDFDLSIIGRYFDNYHTPIFMAILGFFIHYIPNSLVDEVSDFFATWHWSIKAITFAIVVLIIYQSVSAESLPFIYTKF